MDVFSKILHRDVQGSGVGRHGDVLDVIHIDHNIDCDYYFSNVVAAAAAAAVLTNTVQ
jgi:hypothetical protein